jgi:hypothetical protein
MKRYHKHHIVISIACATFEPASMLVGRGQGGTRDWPGQLSRSRPRARDHAQSIAGRQARAVTWEQCLLQYTTTGSNPKVQPFIVILTAFSIFCASVRAEVATPIPNNRNKSYHGIRSRLPRRYIWRYSGGRHGFLCFSFPVWTIVATSTLVHAQLFAMISRLFACR